MADTTHESSDDFGVLVLLAWLFGSFVACLVVWFVLAAVLWGLWRLFLLPLQAVRWVLE